MTFFSALCGVTPRVTPIAAADRGLKNSRNA
jgi:hypothetical protein